MAAAVAMIPQVTVAVMAVTLQPIITAAVEMHRSIRVTFRTLFIMVRIQRLNRS